MLILFALSFALIRILLIPYLWANFLWTYYDQHDKRQDERSSCFDDKIWVVIVFGCLFHALNFYCKFVCVLHSYFFLCSSFYSRFIQLQKN